jgi:hypothetical protein
MDMYGIHRRSFTLTSGERFVTAWAPSYNITSAAIKARTALHYKVKEKRESIYNSKNFDVEWESTLEPKSSFLADDGSYNDIYQHFTESNPTRDRAPAVSHHAALAFFSVIIPALLPTYNSHYDSPFHFEDNASLAAAACIRNPNASANPAYSAATAKAFLAASASTHGCTYAFVTIALPSGATPRTLNEAFASVDAKHWRFATDAEYEQLENAHTWTLVPRSDATNVISGKWVFKIKRNSDGTIDRYKARWVARAWILPKKWS